MNHGRPTLIFLHIPKTAGISVSLVLAKTFPEHERFHVRSEAHHNAPVFSRHHGPIEHLLALPLGERARFRCIFGHMKFGLHRHIPGAANYFTVLRDPLERYLSQVGQYNRMARRDELGSGTKPVSVEEFCHVKPKQMHNPQARFLSGLEHREFIQAADETLLERIGHRLLNRFSAVGTVERFAETLHVLSRVSGWSPASPPRANVAHVRPRREELSPAFVRRFEEINWLDRALFELADQLLTDAVRRVGPLRHSVRDGVRRKAGLADWLPWRRAS